jgi:hypothetical protein
LDRKPGNPDTLRGKPISYSKQMNASTSALSRILPIARWSVWPADRADEAQAAPKLDFVEPMLRRRLSDLAKMSLYVAQDCVRDEPRVRFVYASRHGELHKTTAMLKDLAQNEALSPTAFSLSVLNASAGLFSILRKDPSPATAIAAAEASFGFGVLEAIAQFETDRSTPVLYVYADEEAPALYEVAEPGLFPHAIAMLLSEDAYLHVHLEYDECSEAQTHQQSQSLSFLSCLHEGRSEWRHDGRRWAWQVAQ